MILDLHQQREPAMCRFFHSAMRLHHHRLLRGTWGDLAALKRNADDGDQHPQPDPAHRRLFILVDALMVTLEPKRASWA